MATTNRIKLVIQVRRDTWANWELHKDVVPAIGEPCFITDKNILKIGDGVTSFGNLESINGVKLDVDGKSLVLDGDVLKLAGFDDAEAGAQLVKGDDGTVQWVKPSTETVDGLKVTIGTLQSDVSTLKAEVTDLKAIVGSPKEGSATLLSRIEGLESEMNTLVSGLTDDGKVNTMMELINYVDTHGKEAADMASDITTLQELVGSGPVADQILAAVTESEKKARALYEHVKYEITGTPVGTLVDYRDKEIRVMVPTGAQFTKQAVGTGGDANTYYMTFKTYVPNDNVVGYREHLGDQVDSEILTNFSTDEYGRRYQPTWLGLAKYDETTKIWNYYGNASTAKKYIGWDYQIDWYDANGVVVGSDKIRINLSNESCHNNIEPFYMKDYVKGVKVNGTLLDMVDGVVDIAIEDTLCVKSSDEIDVAEDGTLSIKKISFDKIVQDENTIIVMDGGNAV